MRQMKNVTQILWKKYISIAITAWEISICVLCMKYSYLYIPELYQPMQNGNYLNKH